MCRRWFSPVHSRELDLGDQHRLEPPAVLHFRRRQARTPSTALRFREIHERAILDLQPAEFLEQLLPDDRREPVASARGVHQAVAFVVSEDERVEGLRSNRVAANHELLPAVDAHLLPSARPQAGLVPAVQTLRDQAFKPLRFHRLNEDGQARIERRGVSDWFASFGRIFFSNSSRRTSSGSRITSRPASTITSNTK